jgi:hypothetical protein
LRGTGSVGMALAGTDPKSFGGIVGGVPRYTRYVWKAINKELLQTCPRS